MYAEPFVASWIAVESINIDTITTRYTECNGRKNNARFRNPPVGHQDVPAGGSVPEVTEEVWDNPMSNRAASGEAGPGAADHRGEVDYDLNIMKQAGPIWCDSLDAYRHARRVQGVWARCGLCPWGHDHQHRCLDEVDASVSNKEWLLPGSNWKHLTTIPI